MASTLSPKTLTLLGATGSIGTSTLDLVRKNPQTYRLHALTANSSVKAMRDLVVEFSPPVAVMHDEAAAAELKAALPANFPTQVKGGMEALVEVSQAPEVTQVVSAMVGAVGLRPTHAAIEAGKEVGIANKETLVLAGELMVAKAKETGAALLPIDSEHNAIFQCMRGEQAREVESITLTASGGPFRDYTLDQFNSITREQALNHPNWDMGPKITIDSATMMNKGLEVIEAKWFFGLGPQQINVVIHRQSIIHSLVTFHDGSMMAQLGHPDMRTPISHVLAWPHRLPFDNPRLDLAQLGRMDFAPVEPAKYPCLFLALKALELGGGATAVLNGANEVVVGAYLEDAFSFVTIGRILQEVMEDLATALNGPEVPAFLTHPSTIQATIAADEWGRQAAQKRVERLLAGAA